MKQAQNIQTTIRFSAKDLLPNAQQKIAAWRYITLPKNTKIENLVAKKIAVEGIINSLPFRSILTKDKTGNMLLALNIAMKNTIAKNSAAEIKVEITRLANEPEIRIPTDLKKALNSAPEAKNQWKNITPMARREWVLFIGTGKLEKTREDRIKKACDMLAEGKKRVCCFPGLNWLTKDIDPTSETWTPLPNSKIPSSSKPKKS
jgi:hypothetical protein